MRFALTHGDCEYFCTNRECLYVAGDDLHAAIRDMKAKLTAERDELREELASFVDLCKEENAIDGVVYIGTAVEDLPRIRKLLKGGNK